MEAPLSAPPDRRTNECREDDKVGRKGPEYRAQSTDYVEIPFDMCGFLIGAYGVTIGRITKISGESCEVDRSPPEDANVVKVIVRGTAGQVEKSKYLIREKIYSFRNRERYNAHDRNAPLNHSRWEQDLSPARYSGGTPRVPQPTVQAAASQSLQYQNSPHLAA